VYPSNTFINTSSSTLNNKSSAQIEIKSKSWFLAPNPTVGKQTQHNKHQIDTNLKEFQKRGKIGRNYDSF